jgi:very-short-patch-repair endonuclease
VIPNRPSASRSAGSDARYDSNLSYNAHRYAELQGGHVTRRQLYDAGLSKATVTRWIARGQLVRVYQGVFAVGHRPRNPAERAYAALLAGGPQCALTGAIALVLWGLWRRWPEQPEIVIPGNRRPRGLVAHQSSTLRSRDVTVLQGLRVTSAARTLLDAAPRLTEKQLTRAVNDLRLRKAVTLAALSDVSARNPTHRGVTLLRPLLESTQLEPTRSELEDAFLKLIHRHRLPVPEMNLHVCGHRVDAYFREHRLIVELDGWETHRARTAFVDDRRKDAEILAATGISTIRFVYADTVHRDGATAERLRAILRARTRC